MQKILSGNTFVFGNNVDTDQIYPGRFVEFTDVEDVAKYAMFGADPDFTKKVQKGDFIIAGTNFGCGSSREHAAITLKAVGVGAIIAESYARIFYRNAINLGLPLIVCPNITSLIQTGERLSVDLNSGHISIGTKLLAQAEPMSEYVMHILESGGIKPLIRKTLKGNSMKIAVISPLFSRSRELVAELNASFDDCVFNVDNTLKTKGDIVTFLQGAQGAIVGREVIDDAILAQCPDLKILSRYGVGLDNLDLDALEKRGVALGWSGGTNANSVAEITLGFMLSLIRNLHVSTTLMKNGIWKVNGGRELTGKTIGLFGFGHISKRLIELLAPFRCRILVCNRTQNVDEALKYGIEFASKEQILEEADIISIHLPLVKETHHLFSTKEFEMMKKSAFLINTARGGIVDEDALKIALQERIIAGAALEAFTVEPPQDQELINLPNLICTPHLGGNSEESILAMGYSCINHLKAFFHHES